MPHVRTLFRGNESNSFVSPKIKNIAPLELKELTNDVTFKKGIKEWKPKTVDVGYVRNPYQI